MEVILSTAFGVKAETQTIENDPITEQAKKAMAPNPLIGIMCKYRVPLANNDKLITISLNVILYVLRKQCDLAVFEANI